MISNNVCKHCEKEINKKRRQNRNKKDCFCSAECKKLFRIKSTTVFCKTCNKKFLRPIGHQKKVKNNFCSHSCAAIFNNSGVSRNISKNKPSDCLHCGKKLIYWKNKFCNRTCIWEFKRKKFIEDWKTQKHNGGTGFNVSDIIRRYLFESRGEKCENCGWNTIHPITKKIPLQIDHINGDWRDNREENLRILCPNCHSLTSTFGSLNLGKGRILIGGKGKTSPQCYK